MREMGIRPRSHPTSTSLCALLGEFLHGEVTYADGTFYKGTKEIVSIDSKGLLTQHNYRLPPFLFEQCGKFYGGLK